MANTFHFSLFTFQSLNIIGGRPRRSMTDKQAKCYREHPTMPLCSNNGLNSGSLILSSRYIFLQTFAFTSCVKQRDVRNVLRLSKAKLTLLLERIATNTATNVETNNACLLFVLQVTKRVICVNESKDQSVFISNG